VALGTTGKPKGVITTHRGSFLGAVSNAFEAGLGPTSVYAALLPYFHACGWTFVSPTRS
jgi:acyl-CoA synthetase (AMP-forming)/AMP-acid ligase II